MAYARGFGLNGKSIYCNVAMPKEIWCSFTVDSANINGLGTTSIKSNGYVEYVFMNTSQTPGSVRGRTNPNPPAGFAIISLKSNFNRFLGANLSSYSVPAATPGQTSVTSGSPYIITSLGTASLAQWLAKGFLPGFTPSVGASFIATASGAIGGGATVGSPGVLVPFVVGIIGDPLQMMANASIATNSGAVLMLEFGAPAPTAPTDGSILGLRLCFDGSSVSIQG
jgi:hypothetical protein